MKEWYEISALYDGLSKPESYLHNILSYPEQGVSSSNTRTFKLTLKLNAYLPLGYIKWSQRGPPETKLRLQKFSHWSQALACHVISLMCMKNGKQNIYLMEIIW